MCPHHVLGNQWISYDMDPTVFRMAAQHFPRARMVHLQGWGEPLLHPEFIDMLRLARSASHRLSLTTNGLDLDQATARQVVDIGVDFIAVSVAGATPATHARVRQGLDLDTIHANVRRLNSVKERKHCHLPHVHISYLMTTGNMFELPDAVDQASELGAAEFIATNVDYLPSQGLRHLALFLGTDAERAGYSAVIHEASKRARTRGMTFKASPVDIEEVLVCAADPIHSVFVTVFGGVSPCVYLALPTEGGFPRYFEGETTEMPTVIFGMLGEQSLDSIWNSPAYTHFRQRFADRLTANAQANQSSRIFNTPSRRNQVSMPRPPLECSTCYKKYGV
jgi:MoaA/NifB/PqqE/SkfB family radical SAM enzyme